MLKLNKSKGQKDQVPKLKIKKGIHIHKIEVVEQLYRGKKPTSKSKGLII